eukprot:SAG31_NODE_3887_length_3780_cov_8.208639_2_plen_140_part_00
MSIDLIIECYDVTKFHDRDLLLNTMRSHLVQYSAKMQELCRQYLYDKASMSEGQIEAARSARNYLKQFEKATKVRRHVDFLGIFTDSVLYRLTLTATMKKIDPKRNPKAENKTAFPRKLSRSFRATNRPRRSHLPVAAS